MTDNDIREMTARDRRWFEETIATLSVEPSGMCFIHHDIVGMHRKRPAEYLKEGLIRRETFDAMQNISIYVAAYIDEVPERNTLKYLSYMELHRDTCDGRFLR